MRAVQRGPLIGLLAQSGLLGVLSATVGLGGPGWVVGVLCCLGMAAVLARSLGRHRIHRLGPADWVTLLRATLVCGVAALVADAFDRAAPVPTLVLLAVVALVLDAVDGRVARRTRTASRFGARFDMEVDAFLILILSVYVSRSVGPWVLAIGVARYAFVVAGGLLPWLCGTMPPRYWAKVVAATQGIVLTVAVTELLPHPVTDAALLGALVLLAESFGRQVWWLWRHRDITAPSGGRPRPQSIDGQRPLQAWADGSGLTGAGLTGAGLTGAGLTGAGRRERA